MEKRNNNEIKKFNLNIKKDKYIITFEKSLNEQFIQIKAEKETNKNKTIYEAKIALYELVCINKIFKLCDTIDEAFEILIDIFTKEKGTIKYTEEKNEVYLVFKYEICTKNVQEFMIKLYQQEKDQTKILYEKILIELNELKKQNEENKNNLNNLTQENNNTKEKIEKIISEVDHLKDNKNKEFEFDQFINDINGIKEDNKKLVKDNEDINEKIKTIENKVLDLFSNKNNENNLDEINTKILTNRNEFNFIENIIKEALKNNDNSLSNKNTSYKLIYRASQDGDKAIDFHNCCDNHKPTLSLILTSKGIKIGGYTEQMWNGNKQSSLFKKGENDFCFSIDLNKIYKVNQSSISSIQCCNSYGIDFYSDNHMLFIYDDAFTNGGRCYYTQDEKGFDNFESDFEITNGEQSFGISEIEVFEIGTF